jgi:hypothetical protein
MLGSSPLHRMQVSITFPAEDVAEGVPIAASIVVDLSSSTIALLPLVENFSKAVSAVNATKPIVASILLSDADAAKSSSLLSRLG